MFRRNEDFYLSSDEEGNWSPAINMGKPVNTTFNEGARIFLQMAVGCITPCVTARMALAVVIFTMPTSMTGMEVTRELRQTHQFCQLGFAAIGFI